MNETPYRSFSPAPGFHVIEEGGNMVVRMFLFEGGSEALLIDAGFGGGDLKAFLATLTDKPVRSVVLTHADPDHTGCCGQFERVLMHPAEYDRCRFKNKVDPAAVRPLWEGDRLRVGGRTLEVVLIPGHTPGSIALLDRENRILIGGDSVQSGAIFMFGEGRNLPAFVASMDKLLSLGDVFDVCYASHGEGTVTRDILPALRQGALDVMAGKIEPQEPPRSMPCRFYDCGRVRFLAD